MFCRNCGYDLGRPSRFCPNCGSPIVRTKAVDNSTSSDENKEQQRESDLIYQDDVFDTHKNDKDQRARSSQSYSSKGIDANKESRGSTSSDTRKRNRFIDRNDSGIERVYDGLDSINSKYFRRKIQLGSPDDVPPAHWFWSIVLLLLGIIFLIGKVWLAGLSFIVGGVLVNPVVQFKVDRHKRMLFRIIALALSVLGVIGILFRTPKNKTESTKTEDVVATDNEKQLAVDEAPANEGSVDGDKEIEKNVIEGVQEDMDGDGDIDENDAALQQAMAEWDAVTDEDKQRMQEYSSSNWKCISDTVEGELFRTHIKSYTHEGDYLGGVIIKVQCRITNISGGEIEFWPSQSYRLNNRGIIEKASSDHNGDVIASGATIDTELEFYFRDNYVDFTGMIMEAEGTEIHLIGRPQDPEELDLFEGYYTDPNWQDIMIIDPNEDGTYHLIHIFYIYYSNTKTYDLFDYSEYYDVLPGSQGQFKLDGTEYLWDSNAHTIRRASDDEGNLVMSKRN